MSAYKTILAVAAASAALACAPAALAAGLDTHDKRSPLPEPATWAMLLTGFAGAGVAIRRRGLRYRLVEALPDGQKRSEEFSAPDDATALQRAALVAEGRMELWRGRVLVSP